MLPTPSTSHIQFNSDRITIYEPSEDSFLFLDTLSSDSEKAWLQTHFSSPPHSPQYPIFIVEVGTGSGVIISFLTANASVIFGPSNPVITLGIDINQNACLATRETVTKAIKDISDPGFYLGSIQGDLTNVIRQSTVDVMVFNPPYVPTEDIPLYDIDVKDQYERDSHLLALSYAGGKDGMEVTNKFLQELPRVLSENGVAYLLLCRQNKPDQVKEKIRLWDVALSTGKWMAETVGRSGNKAGWEKLEIIRIWREYNCDQMEE